MSAIPKNIATVRAKIAPLKAEHQALSQYQFSRAETVDMFKARIDALNEQGLRRLQVELRKAATGQAFAPLTVKGAAAVINAPGSAPLTLDLGALLVPLIGDKLIALVEFAAQVIPEGLPRAKRRARLAAIETELLDLEREEERLIVLAENQGVFVERRVDARPEVVLAIAFDR